VATLHREGLASLRAITSAAGVKIEAALYKPFGEQSEWLLPGNPAPETKGWIGERYDADAGLQYLNARYYDPELSLFLQPDWFEVTKAGVGTNRFSYSANDPVNKLDPSGNDWWMSREKSDKFHKQKSDENREAAQVMREGYFKDIPDDQWEAQARGLEEMAAWHEARLGMSRKSRIGWDLLDAIGYATIGSAGSVTNAARSTEEAAETVAKGTGLVPKATKTLGLWGEARLAAILGGAGTKPKAAVKTVLGLRYHDRVVGKVAYEAKAGLDVKLTSQVRTQIDKDASLVSTGAFDMVEWHFFQGAAQDTLDYLTNSGLTYVIH
jgi:RHS repeat-associated protein